MRTGVMDGDMEIDNMRLVHPVTFAHNLKQFAGVLFTQAA